MKAINLLRVVAHKDWGADCATLGWIMVVLCTVLLGIQSWSLLIVCRILRRACLAAFRTSPVLSLHVEAGELPLELRRQQLCLQYICELRSNPVNQLSVVHVALASDAFLRLHQIPSPHLVSEWFIKNLPLEIIHNSIAINSTPYIPPWLVKPPRFHLSLH